MQVMKIVLLQLIIVALALCVLWQDRQVMREGLRLEANRQEMAATREGIRRCEAHLSKLKSPQRILRLVDVLGLQLTHPVPEFRPEPGLRGEEWRVARTSGFEGRGEE
ncbi:MAG: hypothetical protein ACOCTQ_00580 [Planctomycetota bacterium]